MLRVTVELVPFGDEHGGRKILATAIIGNDRTGTPERGNYKALISHRTYPGDEIKCSGAITVADHDRSEPIWTLIRKILEKAGY